MLPTSTRLGFAALTLTLAILHGTAIAAGRQEAMPADVDVPAAAPPAHAALPPIVDFMHSNSGWSAGFSFADPVTEIQWSLDKDGPFESTGFLQAYDPLTRRRMANPSIELDADVPAIYVRYADLQGHWAGPFEVPFNPAAEIKRSHRAILEMTTGAWLAFRHDAPHLLYFSHISSYRCAIREFRVGLDSRVPERIVNLAPCNLKDPSATPQDVDTTIEIDPSVTFASAQLVYQDGTTSKVKIFWR
jgi:hypothetical protein